MRIELTCGHIYGRPFGHRAYAAAMQKVRNNEWTLVAERQWHEYGANGAHKHGRHAIFIEDRHPK